MTRSIVRMVVISCCHGWSPPEGLMQAYPFILTVPPSCFCNSERDAMSGSGLPLPLRLIVTQSSCAPRWMVALYLCLGDAVEPTHIHHEPCSRCVGKLEFRNTVESPTTGSLVDFFRCEDCGHVHAVERQVRTPPLSLRHA